MKLMRNVTPDGQCKYAAVRMDKMPELRAREYGVARNALATLQALGLLENPKPGEQEEFFLIKLKDRYAAHALWSYANAAHGRDPELSDEVAALAQRSGERNPWCRDPDTTYGVARLDGETFSPSDAEGGVR